MDPALSNNSNITNASLAVESNFVNTSASNQTVRPTTDQPVADSKYYSRIKGWNETEVNDTEILIAENAGESSSETGLGLDGRCMFTE